MATIGQSLTSPETGWKRYDNKESVISYEGTNWRLNYTNSSSYNGTVTSLSSYDTGKKTIKFNFTGTKIRIIMMAYNGAYSNLKIQIDTLPEETINTKFSTTTSQCLVFEKSNMKNAEHSVEIWGEGESADIRFDAVDIDSDGNLLQFNKIITVTNKTLILHDGQYKKLNEGVEGSVSYENIIPNMTSNTSPSGVASASSFVRGYEPYKSFNNNFTSDDRWYSAETNGWIQYDFGENNSQIANRYAVRAINFADITMKQAPTKIVLLASNNESQWTQLDSKTNLTWVANERKEFELNNNTAYRYYRLKVTGSSSTIGGLEIIKKTVVDSISPYWETISSTLPTLQQFQDEGINDLASLDRTVITLTPSPMTNKSEILGVGEEGKVFSKTLDLKKYFDIRSIKVNNK